jgi:putative intracellular protease/amidase
VVAHHFTLPPCRLRPWRITGQACLSEKLGTHLHIENGRPGLSLTVCASTHRQPQRRPLLGYGPGVTFGFIMKDIAIVIFDSFTDIDLFLMWDVLGRNKTDWRVKILGTKRAHRSAHGLSIETHGHVTEANGADVVLFSSGKLGVKAAMADRAFMGAFSLDPNRQLIGSICAGSFILAKLGLLASGPATTHPDAKEDLQGLGVEVLDRALVCNGNVATAGGCLSAVYLVAWVVEVLFDRGKRQETLREIVPAGQSAIYNQLIDSSVRDGMKPNGSTAAMPATNQFASPCGFESLPDSLRVGGNAAKAVPST